MADADLRSGCAGVRSVRLRLHERRTSPVGDALAVRHLNLEVAFGFILPFAAYLTSELFHAPA